MYNGHKNWNHWNISLWINGDENIYTWARELVREMGADKAAEHIAQIMGGEKTPDGGVYNKTAIRAALRGILVHMRQSTYRNRRRW